ncbi:hypothetical protein B7494_g2221 [Chlorociboria aeruginascens]|nr:hypothetical protein B7494_g2221 [Chlorociboria aeruginascens]
MAIEKSSLVFDDCVFAMVPNSDLSSRRVVDLQRTLQEHGGVVAEVGSDGLLSLDSLTHIISHTTDFPQYNAVRLQMIPVVTSAWITQSLLRNKQAQIRPFTPDPKLYFSNVNLTCADIPTGDKDAIIGAVLALGGMESNSLTKMTTHICALTLDHPKCQQALDKRLKCKIVLPHWFDDCLKLGKRIDESPYLLPDPEIFRLKPEDTLAIPPSAGIEGATSTTPSILVVPEDSPTRQLDVFKKKKLMISNDLAISSHLRGILEDLVVAGGGSITTSIHKANIYICQFREGRDYVFAARAQIDVGNLSWLYHLITNNEWTSPLRRLLHYPIPPHGIPGFENFRITLSNYGGEARIYLENLVQAAGGEFTKSMKQDNTHLITARKSSEKCTAAEEWNINMVNHLWIEESYARCEVQKLTDPRYTHFPPRTNLGEVIGSTQFEEDTLRNLYFPQDPTPSPDDPKPLKRPIMHDRDLNTKDSKMSDELSVNHLAHHNMNGMTETAEPIRSRPKILSDVSRTMSKASAVIQVTTPSRRTFGKENDTPSSTSSRSAKDRALSKLHDLAPDVALYEKEKKRKGHIWGGDRAANRIEKDKVGERSSSPANNDGDKYSEDEDRPSKRVRIGLPPIEIRLLITSYHGWIDNVNKEDIEKKKLRNLGILVVQDPTNCTHLAAPRIVRTQKFLCALASGPTIVTSDFIDTCVETGEIPAVGAFLLKDHENERKFGLKLKDMVSRAKANKRQLLCRIPIYCTAEIPNGPETYKAIVEANGGTISVYRARGGSIIKPTDPEEDDGEPEPVYLVSGLKPEERKLWPKFEEMAKAGNMIPRIVHSEWLLDVAMSQQLKWHQKYLAMSIDER